MAESSAAQTAPNDRDGAFAHCAALLREHDPDRYWASLFAPAEKRPYLHAIYAFSHEIARVRETVSAPLPGEIRFQWWRDVLDGNNAHGDAASHPVAHALMMTIGRFGLPIQPFHDLIDARVFDLYDDPMPSTSDLEGYSGETSSSLFRLVTLVLAGGREPGGADAAGHGGIAYALTGLLRAFPWHVRRGQVYMPRDVLERHGLNRDSLLAGENKQAVRGVIMEMRGMADTHLRRALGELPGLHPDIKPAFLPLAVVPAYLKLMQGRDYDPMSSLVSLPHWRRLWLLWRTARSFR